MSLQRTVPLTTSLASWETKAVTIQLSHPATSALGNFRTLSICWAEPARLGQLGIWKQTTHRRGELSIILRASTSSSKARRLQLWELSEGPTVGSLAHCQVPEIQDCHHHGDHHPVHSHGRAGKP